MNFKNFYINFFCFVFSASSVYATQTMSFTEEDIVEEQHRPVQSMWPIALFSSPDLASQNRNLYCFQPLFDFIDKQETKKVLLVMDFDGLIYLSNDKRLTQPGLARKIMSVVENPRHHALIITSRGTNELSKVLRLLKEHNIDLMHPANIIDGLSPSNVFTADREKKKRIDKVRILKSILKASNFESFEDWILITAEDDEDYHYAYEREFGGDDYRGLQQVHLFYDKFFLPHCALSLEDPEHYTPPPSPGLSPFELEIEKSWVAWLASMLFGSCFDAE